jgi:hypothetical protein
MEDVLEVYPRPYNPAEPAVCMDEKPFQLPGEVCGSIPMKPGKVEKVDGGYKRGGACSIFIFTEPLAGLRYAEAFKPTYLALKGEVCCSARYGFYAGLNPSDKCLTGVKRPKVPPRTGERALGY